MWGVNTKENDNTSQNKEAFDPDAFVKSIDERISEKIKTLEQKVNEKIDNRQDFAPYINLTVREIYAAQRKKALVEKLQTFQESDAGKMTVKELLTGTSNIALPTMVQAAALIALNNGADLREIANIINVPKGAGKTIDVQLLTQPAFGSWTEGSALSAADPPVAKGTNPL